MDSALALSNSVEPKTQIPREGYVFQQQLKLIPAACKVHGTPVYRSARHVLKFRARRTILIQSRFIRIYFSICVMALVTIPLADGQRLPATPPNANPANPERTPTPVPPEKNSVPEHDLALEGKTIHYNATAGNLLINGDDEQPNASVFYVAYVMTGVTDARARPVTWVREYVAAYGCCRTGTCRDVESRGYGVWSLRDRSQPVQSP
jgi:hypothetical protein